MRFHLPSPELRGCVSSYYLLRAGDQPVDDRLHPEWGNVRFTLSGRWASSLEAASVPGATGAEAPVATLFGPTSRSVRIQGQPGSAVLGIGLLPMGWARLVRVPASRFANRVAPLAELLGRHADLIAEALCHAPDDAARFARLDRCLRTLLRGAPDADPHIGPIHKALVSGEIGTVQAFATALGLQERTLQRLTPRLFGFPLKALLRRQRFLRTLDRIAHNPGRPLSELMDEGYADQPHFVREFRAFMGLSPTAYFAEPRVVMRLAAAERERVVGQTLQGLHTAVD